MHYLIDGHNLIGKLPDIDLADPNDEVKLILLLRQWAAGKRKRRITVIFDGGLPGGRSKDLSTGTVKVIFASAGTTADTLLIQRIKAVKNPGGFTLVTSDRRIVQSAKARRMPHQLSEAFAAALTAERESRSRPQPNPASSEDEPQLSEDELSEWMALFGPEPERPLAKPKRPTPEKPAPKKPKKRRTSLDDAKSGANPLEDDELDEWLRLFGKD